MDVERLRGIPLLSSLDERQLAIAASNLDLVTVESGEDVVRQGSATAGLYLVLRGEVAVVRDVGGVERDLAILGPHAVFGEMSLDRHRPAAATVRTRTPSDLALLPRDRVEVLDRLPGLRDQLAELAARRRAANRIAELEPVSVSTGEVELHLRPLWPDDWRLMQASRSRTSQESLRRRFFSVPNLTEYTMRRFANVDWQDHFAWAALTDADGDGVDDLAAIGRYGRLSDDPHAAEMALLVIDDLQGHGVGRLLMGALAVAADHHGVTDFTATALADNQAIRHLLSSFGATWTPGERGQEVTARWPVAEALAATPEDLRDALDPVVHAVLEATGARPHAEPVTPPA